MEPSNGRTMLGPGKDPDLDQELDINFFSLINSEINCTKPPHIERPDVQFHSSWNNETVSYQTAIRF